MQQNLFTLALAMMIFGKLFGQKMKEVDHGYVFDKAEYHLESVFDAGLDEDHAYVHSGLFLAWLVDNDLVSDFFKEESEDDIQKLKKRESSPCQIFMNWDGVLIGELLNKEGFNFAMYYFDFENGKYLSDYENTLCKDLPDMYHVKDSWENYEKIKVVIDKAHEKWKK